MTSSTRPSVEHLDSISLVFSADNAESGSTGGRGQSTHSSLPPAASLYAEAFGLPVTIAGDEVMVSCGEVLDIITMPRSFACEVNHLLRLRLLKAPIVELSSPDGQPGRWAFLCLPKRPTKADNRMFQLASLEVQHYGAGDSFPLPPSPTCGSDTLRWIAPLPFGVLTPLPLWESVTACALLAKQRSTGR
jgi:hypothetical protein